MPSELEALRASYGNTGHAADYFALGQRLEREGNLPSAATAYDRAYGLAPNDEVIQKTRHHLLKRLAIREHNILFRYIPAGAFLMGSDAGDPDEQPVHPVQLDAFWISDTPITWSAYCDLMDWEPAPESVPRAEPEDRMDYFVLYQENKIRRQYCTETITEDEERQTPRWWQQINEAFVSIDSFGDIRREDPRRPWLYDTKPMVSVSWEAANDLCQHLSTPQISYRLPTEAEWEKAARGGLIGAPYAWGNEPPGAELCDFDHFGRGEYYIQRPRDFAPNGYALFGMNGGVWEWTADWYDAEYYRRSPRKNPQGPKRGKEHVLRGGSWADCAEAITVSYRMARPSRHWGPKSRRGWQAYASPNIGFRLCRTATV